MGKCTICGTKTDEIGFVYERQHGTEYKKRQYYICSDCVSEALIGNKYTLIFYSALQLLWVNVIQRGFFSVLGVTCTLLCSVALVRLILTLLRCLFLQKGNGIGTCLCSFKRYEDEASRLLVLQLDNDARTQGKHLLTTYAYTRRYH